MEIKLGLTYAVAHVYNDEEEETNGLIEAEIIEQRVRKRVTDEYVSPVPPLRHVLIFISNVVTHGSGRDLMIGDHNVRDVTWDTARKPRGGNT